MKKLDMNLLDRYYDEQKIKAKKGTSSRLMLMVSIAGILVAGAFTGKLMLDNSLLNKEIESLNAYLSNGNTMENLAKVNKLQAKLDQLDQIETEVGNLADVIDYIPKLDEYTLDIVDERKPSTVRIVYYNYSENTLNIEVSAAYASDISNYVLHLVESKYFASVNNYGYSFDETSYRYSGTIECILKGGE